jgi:hypothetical protein
MMQFLSLHTFDQTYANTPSLRQNPLLKREALRRLAWCIFYQDTCVDAGQHGVHLLDESGFHIQLPCDEASFLRDVEVPTAFLNAAEARSDQPPIPSVLLGRNPYDPTPHLGLSAHLIRTGNMRRRILHYRSRIRYATESPEDMLRHMTIVERDLRQLIAQLPSDLAYTEQNLFVHASDRPAFVLLHLVRHNCFLMLALTRLNICSRDPGFEERSRAFRRDRIRHALPVSNIVADILRLQIQCDPNIGAHAYTSLESEFESQPVFPIRDRVRVQVRVQDRIRVQACVPIRVPPVMSGLRMWTPLTPQSCSSTLSTSHEPMRRLIHERTSSKRHSNASWTL